MNRLPRFPVVLLVIAACAACIPRLPSATDKAAPLSLTAALEKDQVAVNVGGKLFTSYKFAPSLKKPYLWPVIGPRSGKPLTAESVPNHHPHHNSIWIGCDRVNGQNFWQPHGELKNGQIRSVGPKIVQAEGKEVVFTDECIWQKPGADPVIRDLRRIAIRAPSADLRLMDFAITLQMLTDVTVQKTNHSLFSVRVAPELSVTSGGTLVNAAGRKGEKQTFGVASPWCDYFGTRDGITEGVALFQHPANRWYPCKWFTRDYGFMSPTPMFWPEDGKEQRFPKGEEIALRYRVVVHAGDVKAAGIAGLFDQYALADAERLSEFLEELREYTIGRSRAPLIAIAGLVRESYRSPKLRETMEDRLTSILETDATFDGKQFTCQQLSEVGGERCAPALAKLLMDERLSNAARYALQRNPSPKADEALREALAVLSGDLKIGVIGSIAERRDRSAAPALAEVARGQDTPMASAAISALGRIGGGEAARLLTDLAVSDDLKAVRADALLCCADQMCAGGEIAAASAIYHQMISGDNPTQARMGALEGIVRTEKEKALRSLQEFLKCDDATLQLAAAKFAAGIAGETATRSLAAQLPSLSPKVQVALLASLSVRGDKAAAPDVARLAESADETVRVAAIRGLGPLGDASHVMLLGKAAAAGGPAGKVAADSLLLLTGDGVDARMVSDMKGAEPAVRAALIASLAARRCEAVIPALLGAMKEYNPDVHKAACKALSSLAGRDELPGLVALLLDAQSAAARGDLEQAIAATAARIGNADACAEPVAGALPKANDEAKVNLLAILSRVGGARALAAIRAQLTSENPAVKKAAIQALAEWPDAAPMSELLGLAKGETTEVNQVLALRGYIKQVTMPADRSAEETARMLSEAMGLAKRQEEKRAILSALPRCPCEAALALAESCSKDQQIAAEAELALKTLRRTEGQKFDFQPKGSPVMERFVEVNGKTLFDDRRGYGWLQAPRAERDRKTGTQLTRDLISDSAARTFRVKVPNGRHVVTVFMGDMGPGHDDMQVLADGKLKLEKISTKSGEVKELFFDVDVKNDVLDIELRDGGGKDPNWTCAGLIVGK